MLLVETKSGADGTFSVDGISDTVSHLLLRVLHGGFGAVEHGVYMDSPEPAELKIARTQPVTGRLVSDVDVELSDQEIRVFHLPGVQTRTGVDATFRLDHVPSEIKRAYLVVSTLPEGLTHRRTAVSAGRSDVRVDIVPSAIVRGRAVNGNTGQGVADASVVHDHGPAGLEVVRTDGGGYFEIGRVPPGPVEFRADILVERRVPPSTPVGVSASQPAMPGTPGRLRRFLAQGSTSLEIDAGEVRDGVVIRIY